MTIGPVRVDFLGGVAIVPDKAVSGGGRYVSVADNVDLRSGLPRCISAPSLVGPAARGASHMFYFRGKVWQSSNDRHYVAMLNGNTEMVFWSEEGQYPIKSINGISAAIGTIVPRSAPSVDGVAGSLVVSTVSVNAERNSGNLSAGEVSYRIAVKKGNSIYAPSGSHRVTNQQGDSNTLTWSSVDGADAYVIFGRTPASERVLVEVSPGTTTWRDNGTIAENGSFAQSYEMDSAVRYACTFVRDIGGVKDESGLGPPSPEAPSSSARMLTFNLETDGYFDQPMVDVVDTPSVMVWDSATVARDFQIDSIELNQVTGRLDVVVLQPMGILSGDKVRFNLTDPAWAGVQLEVAVISDTKFSVSGRSVPSDSMPVLNGVTVIETVVEVFNVSSIPTDGSPVYFAGTEAVAMGIAGATRIIDPRLGSRLVFRIPVWVDDGYNNTYGTSEYLNAKYVVGDGRIAYRRIYRSGDTGKWLLVDEIGAHVQAYEDAKPTITLGDEPTSFYNDGAVDINFGPPPKGLTNLCEYMGMLFGIDGNRIRWTPPGMHDAWPEQYSTPAMEYRPVGLLPAGPLMVFCQDRVLRMDGSTPSSLSLTNTNISDGCVAPHTAKSTPVGIMWLARRGVMLSDGMSAKCVTESRISGDFFVKRNSYGQVIADTGTEEPGKPNGIWYPTIATAAYAEAFADGIAMNQYPYPIWTSNVADDVTNQIASFVHNGKYTLYWRDMTDGEFEAHTALQLDLQMDGMPITTMGLKAAWVDVDSLETPRAIVIAGQPDVGELQFLATYAHAPEGVSWSNEDGASTIKMPSPVMGGIAEVSYIKFKVNISTYVGTDMFYIVVKRLTTGDTYTVSRGDSRIVINGDEVTLTPTLPLPPKFGRYTFELVHAGDSKVVTLIPFDQSRMLIIPG